MMKRRGSTRKGVRHSRNLKRVHLRKTRKMRGGGEAVYRIELMRTNDGTISNIVASPQLGTVSLISGNKNSITATGFNSNLGVLKTIRVERAEPMKKMMTPINPIKLNSGSGGTDIKVSTLRGERICVNERGCLAFLKPKRVHQPNMTSVRPQLLERRKTEIMAIPVVDLSKDGLKITNLDVANAGQLNTNGIPSSVDPTKMVNYSIQLVFTTPDVVSVSAPIAK